MSIEALKQEPRALNPDEQRRLTAFLVSLEDARDEGYRKSLPIKLTGRPQICHVGGVGPSWHFDGQQR
ncbi:MAG: hypothetical protein ACREFR_12345 [Limisphaerales bacterium]